MAQNKKPQPDSPYAWVNSVRKYAASIRKAPVKKAEPKKYDKDGNVIGAEKKFTRSDAGNQYIAKKVAEGMSNGALNPKKEAPKATTTAPKKSAPKAPTTAEKRAEMKPIKGISGTGGMLTRVVPTRGGSPTRASEDLGISKSSKEMAKAPSKQGARKYSDQEKQINYLLATGKKKDGTMKASAQRKIQKIRRGK